MAETLNLDDLYTQYTSSEQIKDSFEKRTVPTGRYTFQATKNEPRLASDASPWPGRKMGSFFGRIKDQDGKPKGNLGFDASWEPIQKTDKNGHKRQDTQSSLWGQLVVALDMKEASVAEVITAVGKYPLSIYVNEAFQTPTGWVTARDESQRQELRSAGHDSKNFVQSVSRAT